MRGLPMWNIPSVIAFLNGAVIAIAVVGVSGCAATSPPRFDNSNQMFLEKTVYELDLGAKMAAVLPARSSVSLVSLEGPETRDNALTATLEDQLIRSLLENEFVTLERDRDLLTRLVSERAGERFRLTYLPSDVTIASLGGSAGVGQSGVWTGGYLSGSASVTEIAGAGRDTMMVFETQLDPADYLISYRVLECGIVYRDGSGDNKKRESMVGLHVRVEDTNTGQILFADNLRGTLEDEVDSGQLKDLEQFHYSLYSHDFPVTQGAPTGNREVGDPSRKPRLTGAFLGIVALVALLITAAD